jgi:hypothetical protein
MEKLLGILPYIYFEEPVQLGEEAKKLKPITRCNIEQMQLESDICNFAEFAG